MEIRESDTLCIYAPLAPLLDERECSRLFSELENVNGHLAIDLANISDCTIDFIEQLKAFAQRKKIGVFNIPSDIFVLFNIMNVDKSVKLFVNETDFVEDTRRLLSRKFTIVS